ncbi:hypothetical protein [Caulobacter soli]|uniref:hypothetical protein n=1 Tax=Caulobacter soli TaxID=2708539 RepID=UPI0013EDFCB4|nr:hypothetical protein [Caulobacter soli]
MIALLLAAAAAFTPLKGDFDHDGRPDTARIVHAGDRYVLRVIRGADPRKPATVWDLGRSKPPYPFVAAARAGRFQTACSKGLGRDATPCPRSWVTVKAGDLTFGNAETTEAVALWNGRRFDVEWLSD